MFYYPLGLPNDRNNASEGAAGSSNVATGNLGFTKTANLWSTTFSPSRVGTPKAFSRPPAFQDVTSGSTGICGRLKSSEGKHSEATPEPVRVDETATAEPPPVTPQTRRLRSFGSAVRSGTPAKASPQPPAHRARSTGDLAPLAAPRRRRRKVVDAGADRNRASKLRRVTSEPSLVVHRLHPCNVRPTSPAASPRRTQASVLRDAVVCPSVAPLGATAVQDHAETPGRPASIAASRTALQLSRPPTAVWGAPRSEWGGSAARGRRTPQAPGQKKSSAVSTLALEEF
mmetsp:Transcript_43011/g.103707  ORF Transcript_43011/g.103707 Transcript_43011/m.103707 type:complete len:286 (+) Transcript_43011:2-859(+)